MAIKHKKRKIKINNFKFMINYLIYIIYSKILNQIKFNYFICYLIYIFKLKQNKIIKKIKKTLLEIKIPILNYMKFYMKIIHLKIRIEEDIILLFLMEIMNFNFLVNWTKKFKIMYV